MKRIRHLIFLPFLFAGCDTASVPLYPNSVLSNDLEFIRTSDQSVFTCLSYVGTRRAEMPDSRHDTLFANGTFIFTANYADGTSIEHWAHADFGSQSAAIASVEPVAQAIGKLPTLMRSKLDHVVIHEGDEIAFSEHLGHFFVLYSDNILTRISNHDLEETIFYESVHATLDSQYALSQEWREAQEADGAYITDYAARKPEDEDLAESALFAWTMLIHPDRLPADVETRAREIMPNRLAFFEELFLSKPVFYRIGKERGC